MKYTPVLTCNTNSLCHTDYGIPISAYKSTDYGTSNKKYHRLIPEVPQEFDCRVKAHINPEWLKSDPKVKDEQYKTNYGVAYHTKQKDGDPSGYVPRPVPIDNMNYLRIVQEKLFKEPAPPIEPAISEMKATYYQKFNDYECREVFPPQPYATCKVEALGRDEQPPIRPEHKGSYRLMDPYMTTNRISYIPFTKEQQDGIGRKDIVTFYDASGIPKGGKGYGPRNAPSVEPIFRSKTDEMYDKALFKMKIQNKTIPNKWKRVPNLGMQSEYKGKYTLHTGSDFYPYLDTQLMEFPDPLANAGAWQNLPAPGMYCTDYCHIGTGWPVCTIINPKKPVEYIERNVELCRNKELSKDTNEDICL